MSKTPLKTHSLLTNPTNYGTVIITLSPKHRLEIPVFIINRADGQAISAQALNQGHPPVINPNPKLNLNTNPDPHWINQDYGDPVVISFVAGVKDLFSYGAGTTT